MKLGYARVSTEGQSLDLQLDALNKAGCEEIYQEHASGMKDDREELGKLLKYARPGDAIVIYKLDRLGRSTKKLIELVEYFQTKGIELISLQDSIDTTTAMGKAMFKMMAVLAEMERDLIAERTKAGLDAARSRGRLGGRPPKDKKAVEKAIKLYESKEYTLTEIREMTGITKQTLYKYLKQQPTK